MPLRGIHWATHRTSSRPAGPGPGRGPSGPSGRVCPAGGASRSNPGGATVILVDDVLFSGRTIRAAFDALRDLG